MASTRERWNYFVQAGLAYNLTAPDLIVAGLGVASKQSGPGGSNLHNVFQYTPTADQPTPNTSVFVPNTEPAACLSATTDNMWVKTDGQISNTGWVNANFFLVP